MGAGGNPLHNIDLVADPPQPVQMDGELAGKTPVNIKVVPGLVRILAAA